jgi:hypothetical protein
MRVERRRRAAHRCCFKVHCLRGGLEISGAELVESVWASSMSSEWVLVVVVVVVLLLMVVLLLGGMRCS